MKKSLILAAAVAFPLLGSAAVITDSAAFSFTPTGNETLTLDKFLSTLGTLQSVKITINMTKTGGSMFVDNESETGASGDITQTVRIDLTSADVALLDVGNQPIGQNIDAQSVYAATVTADDGDTNTVLYDNDGFQAGGPDYDGTNFADVIVNDSKFVNSLVWGGYQSAIASTFDIDVDGIQFTDAATFGGAAQATTPTSISGTVEVEYTYIVVPEPSSAALIGLVGAGALLRRRRA